MYTPRCINDSLMRQEAPVCGILLNQDQPGASIWSCMAEKTVVYIDHGIDEQMAYGVAEAIRIGRPVEYRTIGV